MRKIRDSREVLYDANEHTTLVGSILAELRLKPYNIFRHLDVKKKIGIDVGCGDGAMCRTSIMNGAQHVLGIDGKSDMIKIAQQLNSGYERKIDYLEAFIEDISGDQSFDFAILSYLLNNARSFDQLVQQCKSVASFLKKDGVAIVFNNNPFDTNGGDFTKYGFQKILTGTEEGDEIRYNYSPTITLDIINYYIDHKRHEEAFKSAGFSEFRWEPLQLWPEADKTFWRDYFNRENLPVIGMVAKK